MPLKTMPLKTTPLPLAIFVYLSLQLFSLSSFGWPMDSERVVFNIRDPRDSEASATTTFVSTDRANPSSCSIQESSSDEDELNNNDMNELPSVLNSMHFQANEQFSPVAKGEVASGALKRAAGTLGEHQIEAIPTSSSSLMRSAFHDSEASEQDDRQTELAEFTQVSNRFQEQREIQEKKLLLSDLVAQASQSGKANKVIELDSVDSSKGMKFNLIDRLSDHASRRERMEESAKAIRTLLETTYPEGMVDQEIKDSVIKDLQSCFAFQGNQITLAQFKNLVVRLERNLISTSTPATQQLAQQKPERLISREGNCLEVLVPFLGSKGVEINTSESIGEGGFATVYEAQINKEAYVLKLETKRVTLNEPGLNNKFWRSGIGASLIDPPHFAKAELFILEIKKPGEVLEQWSVPLAEIKNFGKSLPSNTEVTRIASLMKHAPGQGLFDLMNLSGAEFNIAEHFDFIADGLFRFLEKTYERNFVHSDIKPENIIYDPKSHYLTVIDPDVGITLRKRGKSADTPSRHDPDGNLPLNPSTAIRLKGTLIYASEKQLLRHSHDASADFYASAQVLKDLNDLMEDRKLARDYTQGATGKKIATELARREEDSGASCWPAFFPTENEKLIQLFFNVADDIDGAFERLKAVIDAKNIVTIRPSYSSIER